MIISKTPYRISLFGGGTDHYEYFSKKGGIVLGGSIDKYIYLSLRELPVFFDHRFRVSWSKIENVTKINNISHPVVRELYKYFNIKKGLELHYDGDLPGNSGTGSSAAFCVGLINCLGNFLKIKMDKKKLYEIGYEIEKIKLRESTGIQDHILASYGGFNKIIFKKKKIYIKKLNIKKSTLDNLERNMIIFYSKVKRRANIVEKSKKIESEKTFKILDKLKSITYNAENELKNSNNIDNIGKMLDETWNLKKEMSKIVSSPKLDNIYKEAKISGAIGGKILGAGGGGFFLFYCKKKNQNKLIKKLNKFTPLKFKFSNEGSKIIENEI